MSQTRERQDAQQHALDSAARAVASGRYHEARRLLGEARQLGARIDRLTGLERTIKEAEDQQARRARLGPWAGLGVAVVGYLILSTGQPPYWGVPVWAVLAFAILPALAGVTVGRLQGSLSERSVRARTAGVVVAAAMFLYTSINLMVVHARIGKTGSTGEVFLLSLFVSAVYSVLAGGVAGAASAYLAWPGRKGDLS